jgi:hypothetical protein
LYEYLSAQHENFMSWTGVAGRAERSCVGPGDLSTTRRGQAR